MVGAALALAVIAVVGFVVRVVWAEARRRDRIDDAVDDAVDLAQARAREVLSRPGATPDNPDVVESAALVEPRARRDGCPYCAGMVHVREHGTELEGARRLRRVVLQCGACGKQSQRFFRIEAPLHD